jgi:hypothetical protein
MVSVNAVRNNGTIRSNCKDFLSAEIRLFKNQQNSPEQYHSVIGLFKISINIV